MSDDGEQPKVSCSFCGTSQDEARLIISKADAYICDACISVCVDMLMDKGAPLLCPLGAAWSWGFRRINRWMMGEAVVSD
jgi:hypothetical protein